MPSCWQINTAASARVIEPLGQVVKLTVLHNGFDPGSSVLEGITQGWPAILASLKTLLETGETLPQPEPAGKAE